ncbi:tripartite tricarboxylate transporter TctB family protein [Paracoccus sp. Z330]|uniref:Tripartite tricarboxylate transporter TctB family protein n=1 Tax=Paracoccus onchidii TaxID=3017813 RepID=A0ABT4ZH18_9RHOB|nr:tripartite tricarboxylate transporter TctB family protein [Paracoccus onchidii]MDB6178397.1 tripartite tricarboxylate transporter TctB family protein [Paracoccus onchidii]
MNAQRDTHLVPSILTAGLGGFLVWKGLSMPHPRGWTSSPGLFPIIIGAVLVLLALLLLIERHKFHSRSTDRKPVAQAAINVKIMGAVCGSLAVYIFALNYLPYEPPTFIYLALAMAAFGSRSPGAILAAALGFTVIISLLFTRVLGTLVPGSYSLLELISW